jgi:hypothetical protein
MESRITKNAKGKDVNMADQRERMVPPLLQNVNTFTR